MTETQTVQDGSLSTVCVWCGYDTAAEGAVRCAECGTAFENRGHIESMTEWAETMVGLGFTCILPATIGLAGLALGSPGRFLFFLSTLGLSTAGLLASIVLFWRLKKDGRTHPKRRHAAIAAIIFLPQVTLYWIIAVLFCVSML